MGNQHAISALTKKLALLKGREQALAADIEDLGQAREAALSQIDTLEEAIRILEPDFDLGTVVATRKHFVMFRRGESAATVWRP